MSLDLMGKSPKMWVNEISVKQLVQAKWDTKEAFPGQSPPTFICRCTITYSDRVLEAEGSGKTKKDAEQEAAREMLFAKLEMTPAKLMQLNAAAKSKEKFGGGSHSEIGLKAAADADAGGDAAEANDVSDTDDKEMEASSNPIGELMAICDCNDLNDPVYYEVKAEGPSHKRVFTMGCKVKDVKLTGRRHKKQQAKKLAAFRVLREIKKQGFEYSSYEDRKGDQSEVEVPSDSTADRITLNEINSKLEGPLTISNKSRFGRSIIEAYGGGGCCTKAPGKCLEYCVDYSHAFHHLPKSETMNEIEVEMQRNSDSLSLLKKVAEELEIRLIIYNGHGINLDNKVVFIGMKMPFKFNVEVPNKSVVSGVGRTIEEAKTNAAIQALKFLKMMIKT